MNLLTLGLDDGTTLTAVLRRTAGPSRSVPLILIVSSLTALILAAAMVWLARRLARPLDAMAAAADRLGTEQRPLPLAEKGPDEVRRTVAAFNRMGARLDRMLQDQRRMVAAVGHDLRTPITALRLRTEFIEDSENRERMIRILDEMQSMTEGILALVRADMAEENPRPTDLSALVQSLADDMADLGMAVDLGDLPPVVHPCRPAGLARAIRNLAENAVRYGGGASLDLARTDAGGVRIRVRDDGPGVPEEALEKVLDPFTRLESSRNSETGGLGLGLAIARMMAERDGGSLRLRNRAEGGLEATIDLPPPDPAATNGS